MSISDWTKISDVSSSIGLSNVYTVEGMATTYGCSITTLSEYVTYIYNNKQNLSSVDNVKIRAKVFAAIDYYLNSSNYIAPTTWDITSANVTISNNGTKLQKTTGNSSTWVYCRKTLTFSPSTTPFGVKFTPYLTGGGSCAIGFSTSASFSLSKSAINTSFSFNLASGVNNVELYAWSASDMVGAGITTTYSYGDIFSIEYNKVLNRIDWKKNGTTIYRDFGMASDGATWYLYTLFYDLNCSFEDVYLHSSSWSTSPFSKPILFVRLQDTTRDSSCYAVICNSGNSGNLSKLVRGNLNSSDYTVLKISGDFIQSQNNPFDIELESVNNPNGTPELKVNHNTIQYYSNSVMPTGGVTPFDRHLGRNAGTLLTSTSPFVGRNSANFYNESYIEVQNTYILPREKKYLEFWFMARDTKQGCVASSKTGTYTGYPGFDYKFILWDGSLYFWYCDGNAWVSTLIDSIQVGNWYFVSMARGGGGYPWYKVFLNGAKKFEKLSGGSIASPTFTWATLLYFGCDGSNYNDYGYDLYQHNFFNGLISMPYIIYPFVNGFTETIALEATQTQRYLDLLANNASDSYYTATNTQGVLYKFNDQQEKVNLISYTDTTLPIVGGGKTGFGVYRNTGTTQQGVTYVDDVTIYTEE